MSENRVALQDESKSTEEPGGTGRGPGALLALVFDSHFSFLRFWESMPSRNA